MTGLHPTTASPCADFHAALAGGLDLRDLDGAYSCGHLKRIARLQHRSWLAAPVHHAAAEQLQLRVVQRGPRPRIGIEGPDGSGQSGRVTLPIETSSAAVDLRSVGGKAVVLRLRVGPRRPPPW